MENNTVNNAEETNVPETSVPETQTAEATQAPAQPTPEVPEVPEAPEAPEAPAEPEAPVEPETPAEPEAPAEPEVPEAPEVPEEGNYNVPQDQWVVSGHKPAIQDSSDGMVAAGGLQSGALLHQGAINLGEIDLSKYSKVIVYVGMDNSQVTIDRHAANANNRLMLVSADTHMTNSPAEETVIASVGYEPMGWAVVAYEIDLTGVDYNGPVYFTYDTLPGTFLLVGSVEFVA